MLFGVEIWLVWFILAAIFIVGEIFTAGFFILWFGIGSAAAGVCALLGLGGAWQWLAFIVVSGILVAVSRRFSEKITKPQPPGIGADRFVGKKGIITGDVDNDKNTGEVRMDREIWRAESSDGQPIARDTRVLVVKVEGTHLIVEPIKEGN